jgi:beta-glucosidase
VTSGAHESSNSHRYRKGRLLAAAVLAGLLAVPATAAASQASATQASATQAAASTSCPWVTSRAPIAQRVAQLMSQMSLADKITMVEGHGTSNPYVFYTPAIPALCIPAVGLEDGPS